MKWILADHDAGAVSRLVEQAHFHPLIARLMVVRGITEAGDAKSFLSSELSSLTGPGAFRDMDRAVNRIRQAVADREKIIIYGDYDVDGVTGSAILFLALREMGGDVGSYIPDRITEGYGLNGTALRAMASRGVKVVITVDCGISAIEEAKIARDGGIDLIITDHHESRAVHSDVEGAPPTVLPDALAVLHPGLLSDGASSDDRERLEGLTGAGMAFKLAQGLLDVPAGDERLARYLDLVTLGTVADMGKITGENRVLVKHGLDMLSSDLSSLRPGLAALRQVAGSTDRRVTVGTVGFSLAPRINASGRLEKADTAFRLLTSANHEEARTLAAALDTVNRERQAVEERIWQEARTACLQADIPNTGAFVLSSDEWHPGVIGIVASRIVEEFYRPTVLIAVKDGTGKGSARSIPGFDLYQGLTRCSDLLLGYGGHKYAAGLSMEADRIAVLRDRLSRIVLDQFGSDGFVRTITIDAPVSFDELTFDLLRNIEQIAPFGQGNPEPRLGAKGLEVTSLRPVGNNKHLKMRLRQQNGLYFDAIAYNKGGTLADRLRCGSRIAAVFVPRFNTWNGNTNIELEIKDIKVER